MESRFFLTVWLKTVDTEKNTKKIATQIQEIAKARSIKLDDDFKISKSGTRITVYGTFPGQDSPEKELESFASAVRTASNRQAKGKILKTSS